MQAKISIPSITVNGVIVPVLNEPVGILVAVFDPNMNMSAHVTKVIKSANCYLRNIGKVRKKINTDTTTSAIVSLMTSRLGYCYHSNGLLRGITDELLTFKCMQGCAPLYLRELLVKQAKDFKIKH